MKKLLLTLFVAIVQLFPLTEAVAQAISPLFFGQNAWMPDTIGPKVLNGKLHQNWHHVQASSAQTVRFGGIAPDEDRPSNFQYIKMIDSIRVRGMEPIVQVPYFNGKWTAAQAAAIVQYVNVTMQRNVKYWVIGNEPDHKYGSTAASQVAPYIKSFSFAMKDVDPTIKLIGPETAWYNTSIIRGLTTPGGSSDITGKDSKGRFIIDIISFHTYPFNGSQNRTDVIDNLMLSGKFNDNLAELKSRLDACNAHHGRTGQNLLKMAVTEANVNYLNSSTDNLQGNGATSFIGGQFWAEMMAIAIKHGVEFINFWSVVEGNNQQLNIGYLDRNTLQRQPSWHHFKLMADHFKGNYSHGTSSHNRIKAFGSKNGSQVTVMVLNQSTSANIDFRVRLNTSAVSGSNTAKVNINAGLATEYSDFIQNQSTLLLVFDLAGNLVKKCEYKMNGHANNNLPPSCTQFSTVPVVTASGPTEFCEGLTVTLSTQHVSGNIYQWKKNGSPVNGATNSSLTVNSTGNYTVDVTQSGSTKTSATTSITVNPLTTLTTSITASTTETCSGQSVTFSVSLNNGGPTPSFQWRRNGNIVGTNAPTYTTTSLQNNDVTTCVVTSSKECVTGSPATSNSITSTVVAPSTATLSITQSDSLLCHGKPVTFTAQTTNSGTSPTFQWMVNGDQRGTNSGSFLHKNPANNDVVECLMVSDKICVTNPSIQSSTGQLKVHRTIATINPLGPLDFCRGDSVVLSSNTGSGYTYQWLRNNIQVQGATGNTLKTGNNGRYKVAVTESGCTAISNELQVDVTSVPMPVIMVNGSADLCETPDVYLYVDEEMGHFYQWKLENNNMFSANKHFFEANDPGTYTLVVTNKCGTGTSDGFEIFACQSNDIENHPGTQVKFYPNPSSGNLTVELVNIQGDRAHIEILNSLGQAIMSEKQEAINGRASHHFTFAPDLAAGIYILKVKAGEFNFNTRIILTNSH